MIRRGALRWRELLARERTPDANHRLARLLAFVAGAVNAGGFLVIGVYTSHATGVISAFADQVVLGQWALALVGLAMVASFVAGAMATAVLTHWARRQGLASVFALPVAVEALLLAGFAALGGQLTAAETPLRALLPVTALMLAFLMGLQNALITAASGYNLRTTHMTGIITDLGIELGRLVYWNRSHDHALDARVQADRERLRQQGAVLGMFVLGGLLGALGFKTLGFACAAILALMLGAAAWPPLRADVLAWRRG